MSKKNKNKQQAPPLSESEVGEEIPVSEEEATEVAMTADVQFPLGEVCATVLVTDPSKDVPGKYRKFQ